MDTTQISNYQDLTLLIEQVRESKDAQDSELKENFTGFVNAVSPVQIVKSTLHEFVKDKDVQFDLVKGGLNLGADFIIENIFNKKNSIQGFLSSVILENVSSSFIQKNAPQMVIGIVKLITKISDKIDTTEDDQTSDLNRNDA